MSSEMPILEAGKHIVVTTEGTKLLTMGDNLFIEFTGDGWSNIKGIGWWSRDSLSRATIDKLYYINPPNRCSDLRLGCQYCPLIWERDSKREALKSKYSTLMDKISELTKQAEEIRKEL